MLGIDNTILAWLLAFAGFCWVVAKVVYRLYFHPLSKFPGTTLAALGWSEFWYEVIRDGTYIWQIEKMHEKYGPVVRINPRELHIRDSDYYGEIYSGGSRLVNKDPATVGVFDVPTAMVATIDHMHHRARRSYLSDYFSKRTTIQFEPELLERVEKLSTRFDEALENKSILNLDAAFAALTADVITVRFYGMHFDYLGKPQFHSAIRDTFAGAMQVFHISRFFPIILRIIKGLPIGFLKAVFPSFAELDGIRHDIAKHAQDSLRSGEEKGSTPVIASMLVDPEVPPEERTIERLMDEGTTLVFAGTETTARSLSVAFFHLSADKSKLFKLREELAALPPPESGMHTLTELDTLPYLTGVVNECLRLAFGAAGRFSRVATHEALEFGDYMIPPGTPVSQSTYFVHTDATIFPEPFQFRPERWIEAAEQGVPLSKYLVSFSKGRRQCLGMNLAYAELFHTIAHIARTFELELHDTTTADIGIHHVTLVGVPKKFRGQKKGYGEVKVKVTKRLI